MQVNIVVPECNPVTPMETDILHTIFLIDVSGSMAGRLFKSTMIGMKKVFDKLGPKDKVTVVYFNTTFDTAVADLKGNIDFSRLEKYLESKIGGRTSMRDAVKHVITCLNYGKSQFKQRELVIFTDGLDTSSICSFDEIRDLMRTCTPADGIKRKNLSITLIGCGIDDDICLQELCEPIHCKYLPCSTAEDAISRTFEKSSNDIAQRTRRIMITIQHTNVNSSKNSVKSESQISNSSTHPNYKKNLPKPKKNIHAERNQYSNAKKQKNHSPRSSNQRPNQGGYTNRKQTNIHVERNQYIHTKKQTNYTSRSDNQQRHSQNRNITNRKQTNIHAEKNQSIFAKEEKSEISEIQTKFQNMNPFEFREQNRTRNDKQNRVTPNRNTHRASQRDKNVMPKFCSSCGTSLQGPFCSFCGNNMQ